MLYYGKMSKNNACNICLEEKDPNELIFGICVNSDAHIFCDTCFNGWKITCKKNYKDLTCPICRSFIMKNKDIKIIFNFIPKSMISSNPQNGTYIHIASNIYNIEYNKMIQNMDLINENSLNISELVNKSIFKNIYYPNNIVLHLFNLLQPILYYDSYINDLKKLFKNAFQSYYNHMYRYTNYLSFENNNRIIEKSEYKNGLKNGYSYTYYYSSSYYNNPASLFKKEYFIDNKLNNVVKYYYPNGNLSLILNYKDGNLNGLFKIFNSNGLLKIKGNYVNNQLNGLLEIYHINGRIRSKIEFKDNKLNGITKLLTNETFSIIEYNEHKLNGIYKSYKVSKNMYRKLNVNILNNIFNIYYDKLDLVDLKLKEDYKIFLLESGYYKNDKKNGNWIVYNKENYKLESQCNYIDNEINLDKDFIFYDIHNNIIRENNDTSYIQYKYNKTEKIENIVYNKINNTFIKNYNNTILHCNIIKTNLLKDLKVDLTQPFTIYNNQNNHHIYMDYKKENNKYILTKYDINNNIEFEVIYNNIDNININNINNIDNIDCEYKMYYGNYVETYSKNKNLKVYAQLKNNKLNGKLIYYTINGNKFIETNFINNKINGDFYEYYVGQNTNMNKIYFNLLILDSISNFQSLLKNIIYLPNSYYGMFDNDIQIQCYDYIKYFEEDIKNLNKYISNNNISNNDILNNKMNLIYKHFIYKDNKKNGTCYEYLPLLDISNEDKIKYMVTYENDIINGVCNLYDSYTTENNIVKIYLKETTYYKDGKKDGLYIKYYKNGNIEAQITYKNNEVYGLYEDYHDNGLLKSKTYLIQNKRNDKYEEYDIIGNPIVISFYDNELLNGLYKDYYENSNIIKSEIMYKNGELNGDYKTYYKNGNLERSTFFNENKYHGKYNTYYENGNEEITLYFDNGVLDKNNIIHYNKNKELIKINHISYLSTITHIVNGVFDHSNHLVVYDI